jgi:hypothetical protein
MDIRSIALYYGAVPERRTSVVTDLRTYSFVYPVDRNLARTCVRAEVPRGQEHAGRQPCLHKETSRCHEPTQRYAGNVPASARSRTTVNHCWL